ncbi:MAG: anthrax toxin-like adenylyl cyclase domain-containing protein [Oligoflexales bacterium]
MNQRTLFTGRYFHYSKLYRFWLLCLGVLVLWQCKESRNSEPPNQPQSEQITSSARQETNQNSSQIRFYACLDKKDQSSSNFTEPALCLQLGEDIFVANQSQELNLTGGFGKVMNKLWKKGGDTSSDLRGPLKPKSPRRNTEVTEIDSTEFGGSKSFDDGIPFTLERFDESLSPTQRNLFGNHLRDFEELEDLAKKRPEQFEDLLAYRRQFMSNGDTPFSQRAKMLDEQIKMARKLKNIEGAKQFELELQNLGKIRKEVETSLENQVQFLRLFKDHLSRLQGLSSQTRGQLNGFVDEAIDARDVNTLIRRFEASDIAIPEEIREQVVTLLNRPLISIARPVEDVGYRNIALGFDGKPVNMKGKSSTVTGFIPLQQQFSKLPARYLEKIKNGASTAEIQGYITELRKYQKKSELGDRTIEKDFLPTSVSKPFFRQIEHSDGSYEFLIGVTPKLDLESLNPTNFAREMEKFVDNGISMRGPGEVFENFDAKLMQLEGESYLAELMASGKLKSDLEIVRHHANPRTQAGLTELMDEFSQAQFVNFSNNFSGLTRSIEGSETLNSLLARVRRDQGESYQDWTSSQWFEALGLPQNRRITNEDFISVVGRENAEILRGLFQELEVRRGNPSMEQAFTLFLQQRKRGVDAPNNSVTTLPRDLQFARDVELARMRSDEISADVDVWAKGQAELVTLDNFNYNVRYGNDADALLTAQIRQDQADVFIHYPRPPDLINSADIPSRLSKHFYENFNTGFPQRLLDDYPLSIQTHVRGKATTKSIEKGSSDNPHGPFIEELEKLAGQGIYMPLNPIDVIKNLGDYCKALDNAPNLSRFILKYFDDFASPRSVGGKKASDADILKNMGLKDTDLENLRNVYNKTKGAVGTQQENLHRGLLKTQQDYDAMLNRLDKFLSQTSKLLPDCITTAFVFGRNNQRNHRLYQISS